MNHTDATNLAREGGVALVGKVGGHGLNAVLNLVLARLLGPEAFGMYAIGWSLMRFVGLLSHLGLDKAVIYYGAQYCESDERRFKGVLLGSMGLALLSGATLGLIIFLLAPWLAEEVFCKPETVTVLRLFAFVFGFYALLIVTSAATTISKRIHYSVLAHEVAQPSFQFVLFLLAYWAGWGVLGAVGGAALSFGLATCLSVYFLRKVFPQILSLHSRPIFHLKDLLSFSVPSAFASVFAMYMVWVAQLLVGRFCTLAEAGIYQAVSQISLLLPIIQAAFTMAIMPTIADLWKGKEQERLEELYRVATKWTLYLAVPVILVILLTPHGVLILLFGAEYASGGTALRILVLAQSVNLATGPVGPLLVMTGHQRQWSFISGIAFVVSLLCGMVLIPRLGIVGAALSITISYIGMYIWGLIKIKHLVMVWVYDVRFLKGVIATGTTLAAMLLILPLLNSSSKIKLIETTVIVFTVFLGMTLLLGLDQEDENLLDLLKSRWQSVFESNSDWKIVDRR